ncbi:glycosyltransferase family 4 protein [Cytophagaceae bacterium DM2B3-1]|uniref:Glycosyltransferase family 4 protein n=1 Tax=Xanthocytophaga flava TaxID=3048013 RepID=A0ABT7CRL1_9BACT|nr:glycosyltransferase family 4 protein [Xanthocytophaga flavus]MDJ1496375.1 glycosyltransferase family 4 protein [Xanthocytophaga flavus]
MKLCLLYPNKEAYSETFIQYHKAYLKPAATLTGGWRPYLDQSDKSIFDFPLSEPIRIFTKRVFSGLYPSLYNSFLDKYLLKIQPEVVLAEYGITGCSVLDICQKRNIPLVVHFHGFDAFDKNTLEQYGSSYKKVFIYAKAIVAVSRDMVNQLVELGADKKKVHFISCGVITEKFRGADPENAQQLVVAVGRFTPKKAPHLTIKAFQLVLEKCPNAKLVMIGKGELWDECQQMIQEMGLQSSIQLVGIKTPDEIMSYLKQARLFVQHSMFNPVNNDSEGTPTSVLEASSMGLPIVSTTHAGIKDAVTHGVTGLLVNEGDFRTMASHMITLLENPALASQMGAQAREKMIHEYDMKLQIQKLTAVLKKV